MCDEKNKIIKMMSDNISKFSEFQYYCLKGKNDNLNEDFYSFEMNIRTHYEQSKIISKNIDNIFILELLKSKDNDLRCTTLMLIRDSFILYDFNLELFDKIIYIAIDGSDNERIIVSTILSEKMVEFYGEKVYFILDKYIENIDCIYELDYYTYNYLYQVVKVFNSKLLIDKVLNKGCISKKNDVLEAYEEIIEDM